MNKHGIKLKYLPATGTLGARIKLQSQRFASSVTVPREYDQENAQVQALQVLGEYGYTVAAFCEMRDGATMALVNEFHPFNEMIGGLGLYENVIAPLSAAFDGMFRRDDIH